MALVGTYRQWWRWCFCAVAWVRPAPHSLKRLEMPEECGRDLVLDKREHDVAMPALLTPASATPECISSKPSGLLTD